MWRIDDLVDLGADARSGAVNAVLLGTGASDPVGALERLLASTDLRHHAAEAAESLSAALPPAGEARDTLLCFVHRYTAIPPR
jgi:hypothetical protein